MFLFLFNYRFYLFSFLCLFLVIGHLQSQNQFHDLDRHIEQARQDWQVPGVAVAIIKDDKIVFAKGFGVTQEGGSNPVNARTIFAIGSCTKAFTVAALASLVEQHQLQWDDKVIEHLPQFQLFDPNATQELTIRDLLSHRSGLKRADLLWYGTTLTREEILNRIRYLKPSWHLRSHFGYQNIMFLAAGEMIPYMTGVSWDDFIHEHFLSPLGMRDTTTSVKDLDKAVSVATPHIKVGNEVKAIPWRNIDNIGPAASINSNVLDMARWVQFQLDQGDFDHHQLLSAQSIKEMYTEQMTIPLNSNASVEYPDAHFLAYGLGWFLHDYKGYQVVEHGGVIDGMSALVAMIPEKHLGVVILANMELSWLPRVLKYEIFDQALGQPFYDWNAYFLRAYDEMCLYGNCKSPFGDQHEVGAAMSPSLAWDKYIGTYHDDLYGDVRISLQNGKLFANFLGFKGELDAYKGDVFKFDPSQSAPTQLTNWFFHFYISSDENIEHVTISELADGVFKRVD